MPSILDQKFKHTIYLNSKFRKEVEQYCSTEIGYRTYYLRKFFGGKTWQIYNDLREDGKIQVKLDDDSHATILALRYAG